MPIPARYSTVLELANRSVVVALYLCVVSACASPVDGLWPPAPGDVGLTVWVSMDTWHGMIAFAVPPCVGVVEEDCPVMEPLAKEADSSGLPLEEWGYAERAWYVEGRQGFRGALGALLWPTEGVVEVGHHSRIWSDRTPDPPADVFTFRLTSTGFRRLVEHLRATIASPIPVAERGGSRFYRGDAAYHLLHTCHHYVAAALRAAGLPVSSAWAFTRSALAAQLRRAERWQRTHD